jgi:hypothetical protein
MTRATAQLIERFTRAPGKPVATPEWISAGDGRLERATYRVWRWGCPVCCEHLDDPRGIYRPLSIDSDGNVQCSATGCDPEEIARHIGDMLVVEDLLDSLEAAA